jgi:hypothetical protein
VDTDAGIEGFLHPKKFAQLIWCFHGRKESGRNGPFGSAKASDRNPGATMPRDSDFIGPSGHDSHGQNIV